MAEPKKKKKPGCIFLLLLLFVITGIIELRNPGILKEVFEQITEYNKENFLVVHYIDVGQGDAHLITTPDGGAILIDAGPGAAKDTLLSYLHSRQITEIDYMILTHPHEDHIGGADEIIRGLKVCNVIMPDVTHTSAAFLKILEAVEESEAKLITAEAGQNYAVGDASFTILAPVSDDYEALNNQSVVLRLDFGKSSFLFTGDAEIQSEKDMIRTFDGSEFKCDVYKAGHHGSTTSNSKDFLDLCDPVYAVISCGKGNDYGHPHTEILELFTKMKIMIYRTDIDGTVVFKTDGTTVEKVK